MKTDRTGPVTALLLETERAHGIYESSELNGVYDAEWPRWYASHAIDHGLAHLLGSNVTVDEVAAALTAAYAEFDATDPKPAEGWAAFVARRLVERR